MKVKWLGHASFLITSDKGIRIITDPYESGGFGGSLNYAPIREEADVVVVSHEHADHNHVTGIRGSPQVVRGAGTHRAHDIELKGVPVYHDTSSGRERGKNAIMTFTVDGLRVCHVGDLGHQPSDEQLAEVGPVDVLLVPVGGNYTIDAAEATRLIERMKPSVVVPMHFRTDKCLFPITGVEEFLKGKEVVHRVDSSELEIKKESLPVETEIFVLQHAL